MMLFWWNAKRSTLAFSSISWDSLVTHSSRKDTIGRSKISANCFQVRYEYVSGFHICLRILRAIATLHLMLAISQGTRSSIQVMTIFICSWNTGALVFISDHNDSNMASAISYGCWLEFAEGRSNGTQWPPFVSYELISLLSLLAWASAWASWHDGSSIVFWALLT